jgi:hypothetical protein
MTTETTVACPILSSFKKRNEKAAVIANCLCGYHDALH